MNVDRVLAKEQAAFALTKSTTLNVYARWEELVAPVNEVIFLSALCLKNHTIQRIQSDFQIQFQSVTGKLIL